MAFTPNSRVYLLDTPLDNKYKNELHFESLTAQYNYFIGRVKHSFEGVTYQRKNNIARVDKHIDDLWNANYVMYQNTNFGSKWFYGFITKMEYVSDRATDVHIETDVFQTWLFETTLKDSFVVREHVADDTIGKHLIDEQLETGEYIQETNEALNHMGGEFFIVAVSDNTPLGSTELIGNIYSHVPTGLSYYVFENNSTGITWLKNTIKAYTDEGKADAIVMIFCIPEFIVENADYVFGEPIESQTMYAFDYIDFPKNLNSLDGYVPRNNKMFTFPYKFFYVTNNAGGAATYRYEDFNYSVDPSKMSFVLTGGIMPDPKIILAPNNYKGQGLKFEYGLTLSGYPLGSWVTDTYAAWLASNGASTAVNLVGSAALLVGGIATGGLGLLAAGGGALNIANQLTQIRQASIQPDQAKGQVGNGNLLHATGMLDFYLSHISIKAQYAKRIDDFFTMFGYKVNALKVPERHSRQRWNYIQTIDVNIDGAIPADDMARLKKVYDEGVTLWHNASDFLNYDLSNPII